jgi:hypothetical protein
MISATWKRFWKRKKLPLWKRLAADVYLGNVSATYTNMENREEKQRWRIKYSV